MARLKQHRGARLLEVNWKAEIRRKAGRLLKEREQRRQQEEKEEFDLKVQVLLGQLQPLPPNVAANDDQVCYRVNWFWDNILGKFIPFVRVTFL